MSQETLERLEHLLLESSVPRKGQALFGGEGLVLLSNQDLASYPTQKPSACSRRESSREHFRLVSP
jgi:hypothetical protein